MEALEARVRKLEDKLVIYHLIARYGPSVDSCLADATASLRVEDGTYDVEGRARVGAKEVGAIVEVEPHLSYVARGSAHVLGMPVVTVDGDHAAATGYSRVYIWQGDGRKVQRASANRWELVRTADGWRVQKRYNRALDGSAASRELLARGIEEDPWGHSD